MKKKPTKEPTMQQVIDANKLAMSVGLPKNFEYYYEPSPKLLDIWRGQAISPTIIGNLKKPK